MLLAVMRSVVGFLAVLAPVAALAAHNPPFLPAREFINAHPFMNERQLHVFSGTPDGTLPYGGLLAGKHGEFFGTTVGGGFLGPNSTFGGTVYEISAAGHEQVLYSFQAGKDGLSPQSSLIADGAGNLYGVTVYGGGSVNCTSGCGTVFQMQFHGSTYTERVIYSFQGLLDGEYPVGTLVLGAGGVLYGTTASGGGGACVGFVPGSTGCGTVFRLTPKGSSFTERVVYGFKGGTDGQNPVAKLVADGSGNLFGTTEFGGRKRKSCLVDPSGSGACGTIFKISSTGKEEILHRFSGGAGDGANPRSALLATSGDFYGLTLTGGSANAGTAFKLIPAGNTYTESLLYVFGQGSSDAARPGELDGLIADSSGNLFGTTEIGGALPCGCGTIFELSPASSGYTEKVVYSFKGVPDGDNPTASLVEVNQTLFGTTFGGGSLCYNGSSTECGTVFKLKL